MFIHCIWHFCIPKKQIDIQSKNMRHACTRVFWQNDIDILLTFVLDVLRTLTPELPAIPDNVKICSSLGMGITALAGSDCDGDTVSCSFDARLISVLQKTAEAVASLPREELEVAPGPAPKWVAYHFLIFIPIWGNDQIWRTFFRWVELDMIDPGGHCCRHPNLYPPSALSSWLWRCREIRYRWQKIKVSGQDTEIERLEGMTSAYFFLRRNSSIL